jgi:hypothetical protein
VTLHGSRVFGGLTREVTGVIRRHLVAAAVPAAILGALVDALEVLRHHLAANILLGLLIALAFELYVGYAELLIAADHRPGARPRVVQMLRRASPRTAALVAASVVAVTMPLAAAGLLILPGLWLMTRWSLFAPAIVHERLGVAASLRRSTELVRGAFWPVACTVTAAVLIEHAVIQLTVHQSEPLLGSPLLGLVGAAIAVMIVSPPAAFTISIVYERLAEGSKPAAAGTVRAAGARSTARAESAA